MPLRSILTTKSILVNVYDFDDIRKYLWNHHYKPVVFDQTWLSWTRWTQL